MAVPTYDALYLPLLHSLADQKIHTNREISTFISKEMDLSPQDLQERLASGGSVFQNRVGWACTYLNKAGLLVRTSRGHYQLSQEGAAVLANPPAVLNNTFLSRYPSFQAFYTPSEQTTETPPADIRTETPNDQIEQAIRSLNQHLAEELLEAIMAKDSDFFEELVVKLLLKMGYGGSLSDSGFVTQKNNDGGIDGIIREDKLGFDKIYIQAKRWNPDTAVSRPEIQKFSGALRDEGAAKGLFITTARFSDGAKASAEKQHIVLVDGERLTRLMIEYNIGVSPVASYEIKSLDSDFFDNAD